MKILIWIGCLFVGALISTLFQENGVLLGAIPTVILYFGVFRLARHLCRLWDERTTEKKIKEGKEAFKHNSSFCKECGQRLKDQAKFCDKCGAETVENPLNNGKFCIKCGSDITHDSSNCHVCFAEIDEK